MTFATGQQAPPAAWLPYGQGEKLVMLIGLWREVAADADKLTPMARELLRALGPPPA